MFTFQVIQIVVAFLSVLTNVALIGSLFLRREPNFQIYRVFLCFGGVHGILYALSTGTIQPIHGISGQVVTVTTSLIVSPEFTLILYRIWLLLTASEWFLLPATMSYHYCVLCRSPISWKTTVPIYISFVLFSLPFGFVVFYSDWLTLSVGSPSDERFVMRVEGVNIWSISASLGLPISLSLLVLIGVGVRVAVHLRAVLKHSSQSKTMKMNANIASMIVWQTICPFVCLVLPPIILVVLLLTAVNVSEYLYLFTIPSMILPFCNSVITCVYVCPPSLICKSKVATSPSSRNGLTVAEQIAMQNIPTNVGGSPPRIPLPPVKAQRIFTG